MTAGPAERTAAELDLRNPGVPAPFLRWAGGKRWLVPRVRELVGAELFRDYYEPFLGGAAVFFGLSISGRAHLSDLNADLIEVYQAVRDHPQEVSGRLQTFENTKESYYSARAASPADAFDRVARFIFLNHTSFNGIFRVNLKGEYNVPYGNRRSINLPNESALVAASGRLQNAQLHAVDFESVLEGAGAGDLVFLDPPYTVAHNNNGFVKYNQHLFSFEDQKRLAAVIARLVDAGANYILTNAAHSSIDELFLPLGRKISVSRRNAIGGISAARGKAEESVFTNIGVK